MKPKGYGRDSPLTTIDLAGGADDREHPGGMFWAIRFFKRDMRYCVAYTPAKWSKVFETRLGQEKTNAFQDFA